MFLYILFGLLALTVVCLAISNHRFRSRLDSVEGQVTRINEELFYGYRNQHSYMKDIQELFDIFRGKYGVVEAKLGTLMAHLGLRYKKTKFPEKVVEEIVKAPK